MKTIDIIGYKRHDLGKKHSNDLRREGQVPCVMYGKDETVHFSSPMILFRDLVYSPDACMVNVDVEGTEYKAILQDVQFHPVSEYIMHADFFILDDKKPVKMNIPVKLTGRAKGVEKGGDLMQKTRHVLVKALPNDMPEEITVDVRPLALGKSIKVKEIPAADYQILTNGEVSLASVVIPRALRSAGMGDDDEEEGGEEAEA